MFRRNVRVSHIRSLFLGIKYPLPLSANSEKEQTKFMLQIVAFGSYGYSYCLWLRFIDVRLCITSLEAKSYLAIATTRAGVTFRTRKKFTGRSITAAFAILFTLLNNYDINMSLRLRESDTIDLQIKNACCIFVIQYNISVEVPRDQGTRYLMRPRLIILRG